MPFAFNQIEPTTIGQVDKWDIPLNRWLGVKFGAGQDFTLGNAVSGFTEDVIYNEGPTMTPEGANKAFGIPGQLKFDQPTTIGRAALLRRRKDAELERAAYLESASHSWASGKAVAGFLSNMAAGFSHPLDLGTAFIPFIGSASKAEGIAKLGGSTMEQWLTRGMITEESIARALPFPRLSTSILNGVMSQAAVEIPVAIEKYRSQAEYGGEDFAMDVLGGGIFAGGLHLTAAGMSKLFKAAAELHDRLHPETHDALAKEHEAATMSGMTARTREYISADRNVIRERLAFDEAAARADAEKIVPRGTESPALNANELIILARQEAQKGGPTGAIFAKLVDRFENGDRSTNLFENIAALSERVYQADKPGAADVSFAKIENASTKEMRRTLYQLDNALNELKNRLPNEPDPLVQRQIRSNIARLENQKQQVEGQLNLAGQPLTPAEKALHKEQILARNDNSTERVRQEQINQLVDAKRREHAATLEGRVEEEYRQQLQREQAEGKILPDELVEQYAAKTVPEDSEIAQVKADAATLEKDVLAAAANDEERATLKAELEAFKEKTYKSEEAAMKAAQPCIGK